jgi:hypothetical protein
MTNPGKILTRALITGSVASAVSAMGLSLLAKAEGKDALNPINVTGHRFHSETARSVIAFDLGRNATALSAQPQLVDVARAEVVGSRRVTV